MSSSSPYFTALSAGDDSSPGASHPAFGHVAAHSFAQASGEDSDSPLAPVGAANLSESVRAARLRFPSGLVQPLGSFRFSKDALLLADFAARLAPISKSEQRVADLGAGCGVVGLAYLLRHISSSTCEHDSVRMVGLEQNAELCAAAQENAAALGFGSAFSVPYTVIAGDVACRETLLTVRQALVDGQALPQELPLFDAVLCNPPWRREGTGRVPVEPARRAALFGNAETLGVFFHAADKLLRQRGSLFTIGGADRLADAVAALPARLKPVRLQFVHPAQEADAVFFIMQAAKGSGTALCIEPPFFLDHE